jgi:hypothetical protein
MFNDEEDESFESSTDSGSDSELEFKGTAKPDSDDEGPPSPLNFPHSQISRLWVGVCWSWLMADDVQSVITRRSTATSVLTDKTSATGKSRSKKEVRILLPLPFPRRPVHATTCSESDV